METVKEYSAGGAILREAPDGINQVLLIRVRKNGFELPKGHVEDGETEQQAAMRECIEEIGINSKIDVQEELGRLSYSFESGESIIEKNVVYFRIESFGELLYQKPKRTREVIWISAEEIESVELVNESLRPIIRRTF